MHAVFACWATSNAYYSNTIIIIAVLAWYIILTESEEEDDQNHERKTLFVESYLIDIVLSLFYGLGHVNASQDKHQASGCPPWTTDTGNNTCHCEWIGAMPEQ